MNTMKAIQVKAPKEPMELVEIPIPEPNDEQVLLKVEACGVCRGDSKVIEGWASRYPRIPGHEIIGTVQKLGSKVTKWKIGDRVGLGWHGGHGETTALTADGGYAPLLCAGETVFSALRNSCARPGDLVTISGIGGLGHLAVQYAKHSGFEVVAISRGKDKETLAKELGAHHYIDSETENIAETLQKLGGAKVIIATAPNPKAISPLIAGLQKGGEVIIAAVSEENIGWSSLDFLKSSGSVKGTFTDINEMEKAINFSVLTGVRPMVEVFPLEKARMAYEKMMSTKVHFRAVLKISD